MLAGLLLATPVVGALSWGVDSASVSDMARDGAKPAYGQSWAGTWMKSSGWSGFENGLRGLRDQGVTPVVMWYYWGDSISTNCVNYGCDGRSKWEWDAMVKDMTHRVKNVMGGKPFVVVLEPEFNKNGIQHWETFDGYLQSQARAIKAIAPEAKVAIGFGHWGGWDIFDRAVYASDYVGFQWMRGSTRDSSTSAVSSADEILRIAKSLKAKWGKEIVVFDLAISTYGNWEWVQEKALQNVLAKRGEMDAVGIEFIVWRYVFDNSLSSGYYGSAEKYWGVKHSWGGKKAAYDELVTLIQGGAPAPATTTSPTTSGGGSTTTTTFTNVGGNEWWIQANVAGSPASVSARVDGGSSLPMAKQSWGAWALSTRAPTGSTVTLTAAYADGSTKSASYRWPDATPVATPTTGTGGGGSAPANPFSGVGGNEWWIQANVANAPTKVEARVNGGAWLAMAKQSWGAWALSTRAPTGSTVELKATYADGATRAAAYEWPSATPVSGGGGTFGATFSNVGGNEWWIQAGVKGTQTVAKVEARVNGGAWIPLADKGWGWATSTKVPAGSKVELRATSATGATATSGAYWW